jgi:hypothetical protein
MHVAVTATHQTLPRKERRIQGEEQNNFRKEQRFQIPKPLLLLPNDTVN